MFGDSKTILFDHRIEGTWGTFDTPAGRVAFLNTKGRLGPSSTDHGWRLTQQLAPVREVLGIKDMDFNQLLQRDLDDHRIAIDLIPYVLKPVHTGPAFFPPIIAVVLPFNGKAPVSHFPPTTTLSPPEHDPEIQAPMGGELYGDVMKFQKLVTETGKDHHLCIARLSWNKERAKLVVIDGQHRAMALVAINRTVNDDWRQSTGEKYETFYSERIKGLMRDLSDRGVSPDLSKVEFPVTICWFPECTSPEHNPHEAARKLFVDINRNAKAPSEARLILLSDTELVNVFTRELLNRVRHPDHALPLYAIEYDNPDSNTTQPARWSVLTTLDMLKNGVLKLAFGPKRYFTDMCAHFGGRPNSHHMDGFMRDRLRVADLYPEEFEDGPQLMKRANIGNEYFPVYDQGEKQRLLNRFIETVGDGMLCILSDVLHYKQHVAALKGVYEGWNTTGNNVGQLAKDALFEGVGMYWTLRDGHLHYEERRRYAREHRQTPPTQPDVSKAWEILTNDKRKEFAKERCRFLLGKSSDPTTEQVAECEELYQSMNTQACQVGAYLAWGAVANVTEGLELREIAPVLVSAWNAAFLSQRTNSEDRRFIFSRKVKNRLNAIRKLDTPLAIHFRYFWLELLCIDKAQEILSQNGFDLRAIQGIRDAARKCYFAYLCSELEKALATSEPALTADERRDKSREQATGGLRRALRHWCAITSEDFDVWLASVQADTPPTSILSEAEEEGDTDFDRALDQTADEEGPLDNFEKKTRE
jgi:hypothetical protein